MPAHFSSSFGLFFNRRPAWFKPLPVKTKKETMFTNPTETENLLTNIYKQYRENTHLHFSGKGWPNLCKCKVFQKISI